MHKKTSSQSGIFNLRVVIALFICGLGASLGWLSFAASPPTGTISTAGPSLAWSGTGTGTPPAGGGESACTEGVNCDSYSLIISGTPSDWAAAIKQVHVRISWTSPSTDYDMYVHKGNLSGPVVASSGSGGSTQEQVDLDPASSNIGTGQFTVHVVYFAATSADQYGGTATVTAAGAKPIPAPAPLAGFAPRFENFNPPAAGPATLGRSSGEPSIGIGLPIAGHPDGRSMFQSDVQTLRVTFNGCAKPLWENKPAPTSQQDFDPILWTDRVTGRTIAHLLSFAANVIVGESSVTDNDGDVWVPSTGSGIASGVDHQTVGGGPYHAPLFGTPPNPTAVYYCSQALVDANCARSDDGGLTYGPSVITYTDQCGGLHGHVKVAPDGTVYLPNKGCGGAQGVVVSEDNGLRWSIRTVPGSTSGGSDPSVGVDGAGKVYFGYADGDSKAVVATSTDNGMTWNRPLDVGAAFGINNVVFPAMIAGDTGRAAFAFLGTPTSGGLQGRAFDGIWRLYVATTYDGGNTWRTVDATPNDAVQRGCIWLAGGANVCRNLLDFMDVQMDREGRIMVGYADGCAGAECNQAPASASGNSYTALAAITRQSGGRRLLAGFDPPEVATAPGMPSLSAHRDGALVRLSWSEADNGGLAIKNYKLYRGTSPGTETLLANVSARSLSYVDKTATNPAVTYYYKITATNAKGTSCGDNEVSAAYVGSSSTGYRVLADPSGVTEPGTAATPDLDIQSLILSQPSSGANAGKMVFTLKVASLASMPNERMWRIVWSSRNSPTAQFYVGMTKDATGNLTYDYGTVATSTVGLVLGLPKTTRVGTPDSGSFTPDGTITIVVSSDKIGSVRAGDLLGSLAVRTYATVTDEIRSTNAIDSSSNATANDATANASTYVVVTPTTGGKKPPGQ